MAYYYKVDSSEDLDVSSYKGFHLHKESVPSLSEPQINYDFSRHVMIELLDDVTPVAKLWEALGLARNKSIVHKRMMLDSHRMKCRRAIVICINSDEAKKIAQNLSQAKIISRTVCAVVIQDLLSDMCLFEKQIIRYGDKRSQQQLLYVTDLNRCREPAGLVQFLRKKFTPFGTILSILVCADSDGYAFPEGVIRFAHLSEAFAAELAYDQYVVGNERLSVTTHHNILLSQCDLRVRLREAQRSNSNQSSMVSEPLEFPFHEPHHCCKSSVVCNDNSSKISLISNSISHSTKSQSPIMFQNINNMGNKKRTNLPNCSKSISCSCSEIDVELKYTNLADCLKGFETCTDSSLSTKRIVDDRVPISSNKISEVKSMDKKNNLMTTSELTLMNQNWSSKVEDWIKNIPSDLNYQNDIDMTECSNSNENIFCNVDVSSLSSNINGIRKIITKENIESESTVDSYVTCSSGGKPSPEKIGNYQNETFSNGNSMVTERYPSTLTPDCKLADSPERERNYATCSQKRKNLSQSSQKLSLKSQRMNSSQNISEFPEKETKEMDCVASNCVTRHGKIPDVYVNKFHLSSDTTVLLKENLSADTTMPFKENISCNTMVPLKLSSWLSEIPSTQHSTPIEQQTSATKNSKCCNKNIPTISVNESISANNKSHMVRRSSRLASRQAVKESIHEIMTNVFNCRESSFVNNETNSCNVLSESTNKLNSENNSTRNLRFASHLQDDINNENIIETYDSRNTFTETSSFSKMNCESYNNLNLQSSLVSPLKPWLKRELIFSTNNRETKSAASKSIIMCATKNKDVIISVGCSYMMCEACYPESTNLLLGYN